MPAVLPFFPFPRQLPSQNTVRAFPFVPNTASGFLFSESLRCFFFAGGPSSSSSAARAFFPVLVLALVLALMLAWLKVGAAPVANASASWRIVNFLCLAPVKFLTCSSASALRGTGLGEEEGKGWREERTTWCTRRVAGRRELVRGKGGSGSESGSWERERGREGTNRRRSQAWPLERCARLGV